MRPPAPFITVPLNQAPSPLAQRSAPPVFSDAKPTLVEVFIDVFSPPPSSSPISPPGHGDMAGGGETGWLDGWGGGDLGLSDLSIPIFDSVTLQRSP